MNKSIQGIVDAATEAAVTRDTYRRIEFLLLDEMRAITERAESDEESTRRATLALSILNEISMRYANLADEWANYARIAKN